MSTLTTVRRIVGRRLLPPESVGDAWRDIGIPEWEESEPPQIGPVWNYFEAVAL